MAAELARLKFGPEFYSGGAQDLEIDWLTTFRFRTSEYDGGESIEFLDSYILKC